MEKMTKVAFSSHSVVRGFENSSSEKNRKKHLSDGGYYIEPQKQKIGSKPIFKRGPKRRKGHAKQSRQIVDRNMYFTPLTALVKLLIEKTNLKYFLSYSCIEDDYHCFLDGTSFHKYKNMQNILLLEFYTDGVRVRKGPKGPGAGPESCLKKPPI